MKIKTIKFDKVRFCKNCKYWTKNRFYKFLPEDQIGECSELKISDMIDIELQTGRDGAFVKEIETNANFFCALFEDKNKIIK